MIVCKHVLQLYPHLNECAVYVPLQTMPLDPIAESFHSATCEETKQWEMGGW